MCAGEGAAATANIRNAPVDKTQHLYNAGGERSGADKWERGKPREGADTSTLPRRQTGTRRMLCFCHTLAETRPACLLPASVVDPAASIPAPSPSSTAFANKLSTSCLGMTAGAPAAE